MGSDKALALFHGIPLIQIALRSLSAAGLEAKIAGSRSDLSAFAQAIPDASPCSGPLGGVHAALAHSAAEWNLFLPIDLPLLPPSLLACLLQRASLTAAPVTVVTLNGRIQPFPVALHRSVLPALEILLAEGKTACHAAWQSLPASVGSSLDSPAIEHLVQCGQCAHSAALPPALWFQSANSPGDLAFLHRFSSILDA